MSEVIRIPCFGEDDGKLIAFEPNMISGFEINRLFYIFDVPSGAVRANHACMNSKIVMIAVNGSVSVSIETNGKTEEYQLTSNTNGLIVPEASWMRAYNFSEDAILMCLSDKQYRDCEYIDDYEEYQRRTSV